MTFSLLFILCTTILIVSFIVYAITEEGIKSVKEKKKEVGNEYLIHFVLQMLFLPIFVILLSFLGFLSLFVALPFQDSEEGDSE